MPRVTKASMKTLFEARVFPPRHQQGCPKNYARTLPMIYLAKGLSLQEIRDKVTTAHNNLPCECKK